MKKKALIIGLVVYFIILASTATVTAIDEFEEYTDEENDVMDVLGENFSRPNIDIINVEYSRIGKNVKITLTVKGNIQNAGDIDNPEKFPQISYSVILATDTNEYDIIYINKVVNSTYNEEDISYDVDGSDLELSFSLYSDEEVYDSLTVFTVDWFSMAEIYLDEFTSEPFDMLDVDAGGPYEGSVGETIEFSGSVNDGTGPFEWEWYLDGDMEIDSTERNPTWTYEEEGEYEVILIVTDSLGGIGSDDTTVEITGSGNGDNDSDGTPLILFVGLIVVIVIVGIAVLVFIIRR